MEISLRIIYIFIKNIELVVVDPSKVQTMNSSSEKLPPGQIEDLWNVCFDGLVDCNSQNDSHTLESLTNETWKVFLTQDLVESTGYQANSINYELVYEKSEHENYFWSKHRTNKIYYPKEPLTGAMQIDPVAGRISPGKEDAGASRNGGKSWRWSRDRWHRLPPLWLSCRARSTDVRFDCSEPVIDFKVQYAVSISGRCYRVIVI